MAIQVTSNNPINTNTQLTTDQIKGKDVTGSGTLGENGPTPDAGQQPGYTALLKSLGSMMPQITGEMVELFLAEISAKMKDIEEQAQTDKFTSDQEAKRASIAEKRAKLDEADKKIQEAIDARNSANIFDIIKMVFQAIGAALMAVLGALLAPVCPVLGGLMIAAAVVAVVMLVDAAVQKGTGMGIAGNLHKLANPNATPEECAKADMGFRIGMAIVGLALAIATAAVSGGSTIAAQLATLSSTVATFKSIATGINTGIAIGTAVGDGVTAGIRADASMKDAEAKKLQASGKDMEALMQMLDEMIDMALSRLIAASNRFNDILDAITEMAEDKSKSLSNAKFTA